MNIAVLNGSPKGEDSVTVQYIKFLRKKYPDHEFKLFNIAHDIQKYEKDAGKFRQIIAETAASDGVMWAFPLYSFLVAGQYKRFIEMIWENGAEKAFRDKYTCVFSTSIHFFDHTAHNYMRGICDDLGMKFTESYSADMDDIFIDERRLCFLKWAGNFLKAISTGAPTSRCYPPVAADAFDYKPGKSGRKVSAGKLKIRILADMEGDKSNVAAMVERFGGKIKGDVRVYDLADVDMKGGCLGCLQCAFDNLCIYRDGFIDFFNQELRDADITIFAGAIRDRYLSSRMKMFRDRCFFNGHIPLNVDKQIGYIIAGPLGQLPNLQEILQGNAEMSGGNLAGVVTDESGDSAQIDALLDAFAARCVDFARKRYMRPQTFLGLGGHKIFRDQIWARLRFPFDADYKYYSENGLFDFPQNDTRYLEFSTQMLAMIQDPKMRNEVRKVIKTEMLKGYEKAVQTK